MYNKFEIKPIAFKYSNIVTVRRDQELVNIDLIENMKERNLYQDKMNQGVDRARVEGGKVKLETCSIVTNTMIMEKYKRNLKPM